MSSSYVIITICWTVTIQSMTMYGNDILFCPNNATSWENVESFRSDKVVSLSSSSVSVAWVQVSGFSYTFRFHSILVWLFGLGAAVSESHYMHMEAVINLITVHASTCIYIEID